MKRRNIAKSIPLLATAACLWASACGGGNKANQVVVTVSPAGGTLTVTQSVTLTAIVTGATDVSSTFDCSFTTTPNATTADPNPKASTPAACTTANGAVGVLSNVQNTSTTANSTATYTAPAVFPDPVKFINLQVIITATSKSDTKKSGKSTLTIDSGIRIQIVPTTATLATGETKQFFAEDFTGTVIPNTGLKWDVTADATATTKSVTCTPGCGTVTADNAIPGATYTAPATVPTQATATIFAVSTIDPVRGAQAAITIVKAGDITFSGISPSVAPQGALQQDIFLAATNATSQIGVKLTNLDDSSFVTIDPARIKVIFPAGSSTASIGARVRLTSEELKKAGHFQIQVSSSNTSITVTGGPFPLNILPNRPTLVGTAPDNVQEAILGQTGGVPVTIEGGYFGPNDGPAVTTLFNFQTPLQSVNHPTARRITGFLPPPSGGNPNAGLFPLSVQYTIKPGAVFPPPAITTASTNIAVIPDYIGSNPPTDLSATPKALTSAGLPLMNAPTISLPANSAPSGIAVDSIAGYAVVTLAGPNTPGSNTNTQNNVQFIHLAGGTPTLGALAASGGNVATAVAVDDNLHVAAVVNFGSRTLSVLSIPSGALLGTVDLSGVIPAPVPPTNPPFVAPFPYSVGVDPVSHRALVAFASTNVGLIVNLDPTATPACLPIAPQAQYCPIAYVTLATGSNPQVAFEPGARLAYVTPGGQGLLSAVSLANPSAGSVGIVSATRASNVVTIKTAAPHNLIPGNPGTVLISGLPAGKTNNTNFNGSFNVGTVLDANNFQYFQADQDDTSTCTATCLASSGIPFLTYTISPSTAGIAFNPVTRMAVLADENVTFAQHLFLDPQSQSITSMTVFAGAVGLVASGSPELGATDVAFQPFSNTAVSLNPKRNEVSLLDPTALQRLAIISTGQNATASVCAANCGSTTPPPTNVALAGALGVDSVHNLAFAVNSGSSNISVIRLGNIKTVHIQQLITPAIDSAATPVPAQLSQAVKITSGVAPTPVGPVRILGTGFTSPSQVRLDGVALPSGNVSFISSEELDVTIPVTMPNPGGPNPIGILTGPRHFALDVVSNAGVGSNVMDFTVVEEIPIPACSGTAAAPGGLAIDELHNIALVTNTACHQVSAISLDPANNFGTVIKAIQTGGTPTDVAVLPKLVITGQAAGSSGVAVVTNNSANTVTILDLVSLAPVTGVTDVAVGTAPSGVAINQETNLAVIANSGSNTVSTIDLTPLTASPIGTLAPATVAVNQNPIAVAIDPDRGTNGRGLAVVTTLQLNGASTPFGALDAVDIGGTVPVKNSSVSISGLLSTPTGIVFDPAVSPALFYATSTEGNQITAFNPDTSGTFTIKVGINPTAIAYNFQTSTILTVNGLSNSISIVDSQTFRTKATLGIGGTSRFSTAIHTLTNLAVIADQANNRVLLFPVPK